MHHWLDISILIRVPATVSLINLENVYNLRPGTPTPTQVRQLVSIKDPGSGI